MIMSRFSLRHWNTNVEPIKEIGNFAPAEPGTCYLRKVRRKNMRFMSAPSFI
jgi:hypothetical protein